MKYRCGAESGRRERTAPLKPPTTKRINVTADQDRRTQSGCSPEKRSRRQVSTNKEWQKRRHDFPGMRLQSGTSWKQSAQRSGMLPRIVCKWRGNESEGRLTDCFNSSEENVTNPANGGKHHDRVASLLCLIGNPSREDGHEKGKKKWWRGEAL